MRGDRRGEEGICKVRERHRESKGERDSLMEGGRDGGKESKGHI